MSRGVDRKEILLDARDYERFRDSLKDAVAKAGADLLAYCLMPNHFHLVIRVGTRPLSAIMQSLLTSYACYFNLRHQRSGHLFEARFYSDSIIEDRQLFNTIRYVHQNPVKAGLVQRACDWKWSSSTGPEDDLPLPADFSPWSSEEPEWVESEPLSLDAIAAIIEARHRLSVDEFRRIRKTQPVIDARRSMVLEAIRYGHRRADIAAWLNTTVMSISRYAGNR
ncbi:MAG: transposase [Elusimicrobiota bacterium]|nr:MAG: transposase [Elusimicrobiota bacterium]